MDFDKLISKTQRTIKALTREQKLLLFFAGIFSLVIIRLFYLQVVQWGYYNELLAGQHYTSSRLQAERGQIFLTDKAWTQLQMTENVKYFTLFMDPKFMETDEHKRRIIDILTPITYEHFCINYGIEEPDKLGCIENIEKFVWESLLPEKNTYYAYSWDQLVFIDTDQYTQSLQAVIDNFSEEKATAMVRAALDKKIQWWVRSRNFLWSFDNETLIAQLQLPPYNKFIEVLGEKNVYIRPSNVQFMDDSVKEVKSLFKQYDEPIESSSIRAAMQEQPVRYIRIMQNINAKIAKRIKDAKTEFFEEKIDNIPILHWLWLETYEKRYYPHGNFMAHILWYVDKQDEAFYWVEEFFDKDLRWTDGKIIGLATPWIGQIWANNFEIAQAKDWVDIYLSIDPVIQKELESTIWWYRNAFYSDSIAVTILDPHTWKVRAMANAPTFNPNEYEKSFELKPLPYSENNLVEDLTYIDIPVFYLSGDTMIQAKADDRNKEWVRKFVFENYLWPQAFVDKNISFPYEPGSIFKALTLWIWIDSDSINLYDFYNDPGFVKIWPFTIANISRQCLWDNTFSHALGYSCNVWMVRIAQAATKYVFYNYLAKLWFGERTGIELANEEWWTLPDFNTVSKARYFNNTYGQGILATPLQMATSYAALINGWIYIEPTIVEAIFDPNEQSYLPLRKKERLRVFKEETSEDMKEALVWVINDWWLQKYKREWLSLWWKTGTSEIAYKGKYQWWAWRTNWSFVWLVTAEDVNYVIAIQVRRPRTSPWWSDTAGLIFSKLSEFLVTYDTIDL